MWCYWQGASSLDIFMWVWDLLPFTSAVYLIPVCLSIMVKLKKTFDTWTLTWILPVIHCFWLILWSVFYVYFHCFIRLIQITMTLLKTLNLFPAEERLRSATGISNLSECVINLTNAHNSLMTSRFLSSIFVVLQMECAECEWTSELGRSWHSTLRLRVEDLTPGKLAEAEKKTEQSPAGRWGREKGRPEVFLISPGQVRSVWRRVWSHSRSKKNALCHPCSAPLQPHEMKSCVNARKCKLFPGHILCARKIPAQFGTLFKSFLERNFGALCCSLCPLSSLISFILIDTTASACG